MGAPRTTVVIATRNRRDELLRTLAQLRRLAPSPPTIVVDNASDDGTAEAVARDAPHAHLIQTTRNLGALARNIGVQRAETPYVAFSDDDSWWHEDALPRAERAFDEHPRLGLVAARTLVGPDERVDPVNRLMEHSPLGTPPNLPGPRLLGFTACSAVVRRSAFLEVGGFSPELFFVAEEKLLAYDLAGAGWELAYMSSVVAHHHPSTSRYGTDKREPLELRNNVLISWMRRPHRVAARDTARLAANALSSAAARRATLGVARKLPSALRNRHPLPPDVERQVRLVER